MNLLSLQGVEEGLPEGRAERGGTRENGKRIVDRGNPLRGSKWRIEKDVDSSCSDVI